MGKIKLICLPYGGGSRTTYDNLINRINKDIECVPIEYKGHGIRYKEGLYNSIQEAGEDVFNIIKNDIVDSRYAFYGHCIGGMITYEVYKNIVKSKLNPPEKIFFGAIGKLNDIEFNDDIFITEFMKENQYVSDKLMYDKIYKFVEPILKKELRISAEYYEQLDKVSIDCDVVLINGNEDKFVNVNALKPLNDIGQYLLCKI